MGNNCLDPIKLLLDQAIVPTRNLDFSLPPYLVGGVKYIDLVSLALAAGPGHRQVERGCRFFYSGGCHTYGLVAMSFK